MPVIFCWLVGWFLFYGISRPVGYLMPNPVYTYDLLTNSFYITIFT